MKSLDPRVNRLPYSIDSPPMRAKAPFDQFGTFEVFVQPREGKPFQHEGAVHAPDLELAFVLAKETFTRRFTCKSLFVAETRTFLVSAMTEDNMLKLMAFLDKSKNPVLVQVPRSEYAEMKKRYNLPSI